MMRRFERTRGRWLGLAALGVVGVLVLTGLVSGSLGLPKGALASSEPSPGSLAGSPEPQQSGLPAVTLQSIEDVYYENEGELGNGAPGVRVRVQPASNEALSVRYTITGFDGIEGAPQVIVVPAGASVAKILVDVERDDDIDDIVQTKLVRLQEAGAEFGYVLGSSVEVVVKVVEGICDRTEQVRTAILDQLARPGCYAVTSDDLAGITLLNLSGSGIVALKSRDFEGLALEKVYLSGNNLSELPPGLFVGLVNLTDYDLRDNDGDLVIRPVVTGNENHEILVEIVEGAPRDVTVPFQVDFGGTAGVRSYSATVGVGQAFSPLVNVLDGLPAPDGLYRAEVSPFEPAEDGRGLRFEEGESFMPDVAVYTVNLEDPVAPMDDGRYVVYENGLRTVDIPISAHAVVGKSLSVTYTLTYDGVLPVGGELPTDVDQQFAVLKDFEISGQLYTVTLDGVKILKGTATISANEKIGHIRFQVKDDPHVDSSADERFSVVLDPFDYRYRYKAGENAGPVEWFLREGICDRSDLSRRALNARLEAGGDPCEDVSAAELSGLAGHFGVSHLDENAQVIDDLFKVGDFRDLSGVSSMSVHHEDMESSFVSGMFEGLEVLDVLFIHDAGLSSISPDWFQDLGHLRGLFFNQGALESVPGDLLMHLGDLDSLRLWVNDLTSLPWDLFEGHSGMVEFNASSNQIQSLHGRLFECVTALNYLDLSDNSSDDFKYSVKIVHLGNEVEPGRTLAKYKVLTDNHTPFRIEGYLSVEAGGTSVVPDGDEGGMLGFYIPAGTTGGGEDVPDFAVDVTGQTDDVKFLFHGTRWVPPGEYALEFHGVELVVPEMMVPAEENFPRIVEFPSSPLRCE